MQNDFAKIEETLNNILLKMSKTLEQQDKSLIEEFLDHGEYEVALHWLESSIEKNNIDISDDIKKSLLMIRRDFS